MLFNSYGFIVLFLPVVFGGHYWLLARGRVRESIGFLVVASLLFYSWWRPEYLLLLAGSVLVNFGLGVWQQRKHDGQGEGDRLVLVVACALNLCLLAFFKYSTFLVGGFAPGFAARLNLDGLVLPLAISFFTFQQIAYQVDVWRGTTAGYDWLEYVLFVTFFPQLIAGPIVHHAEVVPQFRDRRRAVTGQLVAVGLALFSIGLFKKVVLADNTAAYADAVFGAASDGIEVGLTTAWLGVLSYSMQIYFDFSGYSDMALGLGLLFGVRLAVNFASPYRASNIIEFWRRWHITLSRFLRDYLYFPLGGNRRGVRRRYLNLMVTMLLGGLWHGAGLTFVVWGGLHGAFLVVNHGWRRLCGERRAGSQLQTAAGWLLTFCAVSFAWVYFRAPSVEVANDLAGALLGANGLSGGLANHVDSPVGLHEAIASAVPSWAVGWGWLTLLLVIVLALPNAVEFVDHYAGLGGRQHDGAVRWRPSVAWAVVCGLLLALAIVDLGAASEFIYYQF